MITYGCSLMTILRSHRNSPRRHRKNPEHNLNTFFGVGTTFPGKSVVNWCHVWRSSTDRKSHFLDTDLIGAEGISLPKNRCQTPFPPTQSSTFYPVKIGVLRTSSIYINGYFSQWPSSFHSLCSRKLHCEK